MEIANSQEYYDKMLKDAIQKLNSLKSVCGGEGVAYFLDDNFVIKEFTNKKDMFTFNATFNAYVEDLKWAREEGVNMPKIYSHLKLEDKTRKWPYRYFILEERFKYDNIFPNYITEFYGDCKDVCSASEFGEILHNPDQNKGIYREILNRYYKKFIEANQRLYNLEESKVAKFVSDIFKYNMEAHASETDVHVDNTFISKEGIYLIDPYIVLGYRVPDLYYLTNISIEEIFRLFYTNDVPNCPHEYIADTLADGCGYFDSNLIEANKKWSYEAQLRFLKIMNKYCDNPVFRNKRVFEGMSKELEKIYGNEQSMKLLDNISYEPEK